MKGDLDDQTLDELATLSEAEAGCVIDRLSEADIQRVRDMNRFLGGIIRRVRQDGPDRGQATLDTLPRRVSNAIEDLIADVSTLMWIKIYPVTCILFP